MVKELGIIVPYLREKGRPPAFTGSPGKRRGAAAKGPKRLFTKNTGLCQAARRSIGSDACPVPEGHGDPLERSKR